MKAADKVEQGTQAPQGAAAARRARRLAREQADAMPAVEPGDGPRRTRQVRGELTSPSPRGGMWEVVQHPYVLRLIVRRQLAAMYSASVLGLLWSYVQPALRFIVYYLIIGFVLNLHRDVPYFALHLFSGLVVVSYFGETWNGGTRSIWQNRALIQKMRMPREVFPVAAMLVACYHTLPQVLVLVTACLVIGWSVTWTSLAAGLLGMAILVTFSLALGLFFAAVNVFARDFQNIVSTVMQFMHFLVPMLYPFERIYAYHESHPVIYQIYVANPVAQAVMLLQRFFWQPLAKDEIAISTSFPPDQWSRGLITLAICVLLLFLAQRFFSRAENKFPERL